MDNKEIRFIDSHYNELFRIPDGGQIMITTPDGGKYEQIVNTLMNIIQILMVDVIIFVNGQN